MNRHSIFFSLSLGFALSVCLVVASFVFLLSHNAQNEKIALIRHYQSLIRGKKYFDEEFLKDTNLKLVVDKKAILSKAKSIIQNNRLEVLSLENRRFIYLKKHHGDYLFLDTKPFKEDFKPYIYLVFSFVLFIMFISFVLSIKKLLPLKTLKQNVSFLGDENYDIISFTDKKDELSLLSNEFAKTAIKLKNIKEARNVFIRNILHELKTPITKARFFLELENSKEKDEKISQVFYTIELLINEFASIEELISLKQLDKKNYFLDDIMDNAKDKLLIDNKSVICKYENRKIEVNFKLFSIACKNLIDNGIKYSSDKKITIQSKAKNICFKSKGKALKYDFEVYLKPFFKAQNTQNSFGLGLYIVKNILDAHGIGFSYVHKKGYNYFLIGI